MSEKDEGETPKVETPETSNGEEIKTGDESSEGTDSAEKFSKLKGEGIRQDKANVAYLSEQIEAIKDDANRAKARELFERVQREKQEKRKRSTLEGLIEIMGGDDFDFKNHEEVLNSIVDFEELIKNSDKTEEEKKGLYMELDNIFANRYKSRSKISNMFKKDAKETQANSIVLKFREQIQDPIHAQGVENDINEWMRDYSRQGTSRSMGRKLNAEFQEKMQYVKNEGNI
jgi:hypothetical protein